MDNQSHIRINIRPVLIKLGENCGGSKTPNDKRQNKRRKSSFSAIKPNFLYTTLDNDSELNNAKMATTEIIQV